MAVQAQFLRSSNAFEDDHIRCLLGSHHHPPPPPPPTVGGVLSDDPKSAGLVRKRKRDTAQQFPIPVASKIPKPAISDNNRAIGSAGTSTSGSQHISEMDALIRLHNAKLRSGLDEIQKRHYATIARNFENQSAKKIAEKDAEIEALRRKRADLESRLEQIAAEGRFWVDAASNSEVIASNLKASLDQVLRRGAEAGGGGESGRAAEDAESCCYGGEGVGRKGRRSCLVCRERDVSVLLLPCRHLCLCAECEPVADTCPICSAAKNFGLQVFME